MNGIKHITEQPFIAATGVAALVHSTWSLAVLFSGEPPAWEPTSIAAWLRWVYWLVPALLIAFALDVGQIATSSEIRAGERTRSKYITFIVFAAATYYLQWIYIAHHMPALELGAGVYRDGLAGRLVLLTRNAAIWFIPALLPLSTTMYTLSGGKPEPAQEQPIRDALLVEAQQLEKPRLVEQNSTLEPAQNAQDVTEHPGDEYYPFWLHDILEEEAQPGFTSKCECGWQNTYDNPDSAKRGLAAHKAHCPALHPELVEQYSNGHK